MKKLQLLFITLIFPITLFSQSNGKTEKIPEFMQESRPTITEKDTVEFKVFCFDKLDKQINSQEYHKLEEVKKCKLFFKKFSMRTKTYVDYNQFIKKDSLYKIHSEYFNLNKKKWLKKKYVDGLVVSENNIYVTDTITSTAKSTIYLINTNDTILITRQYLKTKIIE